MNPHKNSVKDLNESAKQKCAPGLDKTVNKTPLKVAKSSTIITNDNFHEEAKYFSCKTCDKSYTQSHNLKKHTKLAHEGGEKLSCKLCDKSYTQDHNLKIHIRTFHQGTKISCISCDKSFAQSHSLKKHIKMVHEGTKTNLTISKKSTEVPPKNCYSYS